MADLTAIAVQVRAQLAAWRGHGRRIRERLARSRHVLVSVLLVVAGLAGALGGGWLIGRWCLGLVLLAESGGAVWFGLMRDDGTALPRRGERTIADVAEEYRRLPS
jgi:hypothetical protein